MKTAKLNKILIEVERFKKAIHEAIDKNNDPYYKEYGIGGTHASGAVKRKFIDMKYEVNKILNK